MVTFEEFKADLWNMIEKAIYNGVDGEHIINTLIEFLHIDREKAATMVVSVGAQLNLKHNPEMTWQQAFKAYAFGE